MQRAAHHAKQVYEIIPTIAAHVLSRNDGQLIVRTYKGGLANMLFFWVNGQRYCLAYNHNTGEIEVRNRTTRGASQASFTNATPNAVVRQFFEAL
jgi:hypothetical protein